MKTLIEGVAYLFFHNKPEEINQVLHYMWKVHCCIIIWLLYFSTPSDTHTHMGIWTPKNRINIITLTGILKEQTLALWDVVKSSFDKKKYMKESQKDIAFL